MTASTPVTPSGGDPKMMARRLRAELATRGLGVTHSEALELVAHQLGARDWNTLAATRPGLDGHAIPILRVFDETKAMEFYVDFLGFHVDWRHEDHDHEPMYVQVSRGPARLHLSGHHGDASPGSGVLLPVPDARSLQQALRAKRYAYANPGLQEVPWGRVVTVIDPFSNRLVFHEPHAASRTAAAEGDGPAAATDPSASPGDAAAPIVHDLWVPCPPDRAYELFTDRFGEWWPHDAYSPGPLAGIRLEPRVGGAVTMLLADGGAYALGEVLVWAPPHRYAQSFTLAQDPAHPSRLEVTFEGAPHVGGTRVRFAHGGWTPENVDGRARFSEWDILLGRYAALAASLA